LTCTWPPCDTGCVQRVETNKKCSSLISENFEDFYFGVGRVKVMEK
jgi:hypothetical protein